MNEAVASDILPRAMRAIVAELIGTALLVAAVVGSGIMGERLSGGNLALALLANSIATGAVLVTLIFTFAPISGAHFNPGDALLVVRPILLEQSDVARLPRVARTGNGNDSDRGLKTHLP